MTPDDETKRRALIQRMQENGQDVRARLVTLTTIAVEALKCLQLLNGGAIIALFTLLARDSNSELARRLNEPTTFVAFGGFALGLTFGMAAFMVAYAAQNQFSAYEQDAAERTYELAVGLPPRTPAEAERTLGEGLGTLAFILAGLSLLGFVGGAGLLLWAAIY